MRHDILDGYSKRLLIKQSKALTNYIYNYRNRRRRKKWLKRFIKYTNNHDKYYLGRVIDRPLDFWLSMLNPYTFAEARRNNFTYKHYKYTTNKKFYADVSVSDKIKNGDVIV